MSKIESERLREEREKTKQRESLVREREKNKRKFKCSQVYLTDISEVITESSTFHYWYFDT